MPVTLDASVLVSAYLASDVHHGQSLRLLGALMEAKVDIHVPTLLLSEVAAALARNSREPKRGLAAIEIIEETSGIRLHSISLALAKKAAELASTSFLRGADAIYAAVAQATSSTLITLDNEMRQRAAKSAPTLTPSEWLCRTADHN